MAQPAPGERPAYVITGPTSGIGYQTALELARPGTVVLVGRDRRRLDAVRVVGDRADIGAVRRVAAEITTLGLPLAGLVNNAGITQLRPTTNAQGWHTVFATDHVSPFVLTE